VGIGRETLDGNRGKEGRPGRKNHETDELPFLRQGMTWPALPAIRMRPRKEAREKESNTIVGPLFVCCFPCRSRVLRGTYFAVGSWLVTRLSALPGKGKTNRGRQWRRKASVGGSGFLRYVLNRVVTPGGRFTIHHLMVRGRKCKGGRLYRKLPLFICAKLAAPYGYRAHRMRRCAEFEA